jgi:hypothetical protein
VACPNTGAMLGLDAPGSVVWLSQSASVTRKYRHTWELVELDDALIGINPMRPNTIVAEAIAANLIPQLAGYERMRREVKYGEKSRVDILLEGDAGRRASSRSRTCICRALPASPSSPTASRRAAPGTSPSSPPWPRAARGPPWSIWCSAATRQAFALARDIDPNTPPPSARPAPRGSRPSHSVAG